MAQANITERDDYFKLINSSDFLNLSRRTQKRIRQKFSDNQYTYEEDFTKAERKNGLAARVITIMDKITDAHNANTAEKHTEMVNETRLAQGKRAIEQGAPETTKVQETYVQAEAEEQNPQARVKAPEQNPPQTTEVSNKPSSSPEQHNEHVVYNPIHKDDVGYDDRAYPTQDSDQSQASIPLPVDGEKRDKIVKKAQKRNRSRSWSKVQKYLLERVR